MNSKIPILAFSTFWCRWTTIMHRSLDMLIVGQRMMHTLLNSIHYNTSWQNGKKRSGIWSISCPLLDLRILTHNQRRFIKPQYGSIRSIVPIDRSVFPAAAPNHQPPFCPWTIAHWAWQNSRFKNTIWTIAHWAWQNSCFTGTSWTTTHWARQSLNSNGQCEPLALGVLDFGIWAC